MTKPQLLNLVKSLLVLVAVTACGLININANETPTSPPVVPVTEDASTETACVAELVEQSFENGFMFWVGRTSDEKCAHEHGFAPGSGEIWIAFVNSKIPSGKWLVYVDDWTAGADPDNDQSLTPPPGLIQPIRGFGKVWRTKLSAEEREMLGWATGSEFLISSDYRYKANVFINSQGETINRPGKHILVGLAGDIFTFDEVSQTVTYEPAP